MHRYHNVVMMYVNSSPDEWKDWVKDFIKNNSKHLASEHKDSIYKINLAYIYFSNEERGEAYNILPVSLPSFDIHYAFLYTTITLIINYERGGVNLEKLADNLQNQVRLNSYPDESKKPSLLRFIRFFKKMINFRYTPTELLKELEDYDTIGKNWFETQIYKGIKL